MIAGRTPGSSDMTSRVAARTASMSRPRSLLLLMMHSLLTRSSGGSQELTPRQRVEWMTRADKKGPGTQVAFVLSLNPGPGHVLNVSAQRDSQPLIVVNGQKDKTRTGPLNRARVGIQLPANLFRPLLRPLIRLVYRLLLRLNHIRLSSISHRPYAVASIPDINGI